jgi:hypothetical protein
MRCAADVAMCRQMKELFIDLAVVSRHSINPRPDLEHVRQTRYHFPRKPS